MNKKFGILAMLLAVASILSGCADYYDGASTKKSGSSNDDLIVGQADYIVSISELFDHCAEQKYSAILDESRGDFTLNFGGAEFVLVVYHKQDIVIYEQNESFSKDFNVYETDFFGKEGRICKGEGIERFPYWDIGTLRFTIETLDGSSYPNVEVYVYQSAVSKDACVILSESPGQKNYCSDVIAIIDKTYVFSYQEDPGEIKFLYRDTDDANVVKVINLSPTIKKDCDGNNNLFERNHVTFEAVDFSECYGKIGCFISNKGVPVFIRPQ